MYDLEMGEKLLSSSQTDKEMRRADAIPIGSRYFTQIRLSAKAGVCVIESCE